jgi:hypothetical protein
VTIDPRTRRFPKVLADRLKLALDLTRPLGPDRCLELLAIYRRNMLRGVTNYMAERLRNNRDDYEPFPMEWFDKIKELDAVFRELHKFREPGGEAEYIASAVYSMAQQFNGQRGRRRETNDEDIRREAARLGYFGLPRHSRKKAEILDEIIANLRLYHGVGTARPSQHRHLKRILDVDVDI